MAKSHNKEREQHILNIAAKLFVQYGYDKTPVSEIARGAGVSQGTIYLHFKSKDALFEALLLREMQTYAEKWMALIDADPKGGTIGAMYKNSLYALSSSAFMAAIFKRDRRILGSYIRKPGSIFQQEQHKSRRYEFVKLMQQVGAIRQDLDPRVVAHVMNILAYGLVAMDEVMDKDDIPPTEDIIEGIADIMDRALTPEDGGNNEAGKMILKQIAEAARQQLEQDQNKDQEGLDEP